MEMGKLNCEPIINHFSHPHPLELLNLQNQTPNNAPKCYGCNQNSCGLTYTCKICNFFLHIICSQMPHNINHPFDLNHSLSLLPRPAYPEGFFNCDACGKNGNGFSYHCVACNIDLHILCAALPLSLTNQSHHHPLGLAFFPPYDNKGFSCDICKNFGSNSWLYRCNACEFDAHLSCGTANAQLNRQLMGTQQQQMVLGVAPQQFQATGSGGFINGQRVEPQEFQAPKGGATLQMGQSSGSGGEWCADFPSGSVLDIDFSDFGSVWDDF